MRFLVRFIPPRPWFAWHKTEDEKDVMGRHVSYLNELAAKGIPLSGPWIALEQPWEFWVLDVESEDEANRLMSLDPAVTSGLNTVAVSVWTPASEADHRTH